ncbi:MAG: hypoxanthine phosphoribosyltransferase [Cyanobacteria bacterium SIG30]|nr:hypoxanthine phosphoribosyltransferase [Cyanobacteria bacterium SIG30]
MKELKTLISEEELTKRIKEVAEEINNFYGDEKLTVICVLKGAIMFCSHLIKYLKMPVELECVRLSSYGTSTKSSGKVKALDLTLPQLEGKNVLVVEDIIDTGLTLKFLKDYIESTLNPKTLKIATLIDKKISRLNDMQPDFYGFDIDDKFIVGFGLDYEEIYRNIPYIGYFE